MASVAEHYGNLLSDVYSWMAGGFDQGVADNVAFFARHGISPRGGGLAPRGGGVAVDRSAGVAVDLGAGCGFQSIPLARAGFRVTAIDLDRALLDELERHRGELPVRTVAGDLMRFDEHVDGPVELVVCMTDTLLHLDSAADVERLLAKVFSVLAPDGRFVATLRDLSRPLEGSERFIPVRADDGQILTCFLEYENDTVKVHDLLYRRSDDGWQLSKSFYRKLRLPAARFRAQLEAAGFAPVDLSVERGLVTAIAEKPR